MKYKIGDNVTFKGKQGTVVNITKSDSYPIVVEFDDGLNCFMSDGHEWNGEEHVLIPVSSEKSNILARLDRLEKEIFGGKDD